MKKYSLPLIGLIALIAGGAFFVYTNTQQMQGTQPEDQQYTIEEIPIESVEAPQVRLPVVDQSLPEEVRSRLIERAEEIQVQLQQNPDEGAWWLELGVIFHSAGDYEGAREIWEFLIRAAPTHTTSYDNLGKLYHYQLKDFEKAESYFTQSLATDAAVLIPYLELHNLYRYSYKTDTTLAADILKTAIAQFPETIELHLTLGAYYRDTGNYTAARQTLETGLEKARDAGTVDLIAQFGQELERINSL